MALIELKNICLSYGGPVLLDRVDLAIEPGERVCLLGRNGEGKSSLIKIISGDLLPDKGEITRVQGLREGVLEQEVPGSMPGTVFDVVAGGNPMLTIGGKTRNACGYLQNFLFAPELAWSLVGSLSGGESTDSFLPGLRTLPSIRREASV